MIFSNPEHDFVFVMDSPQTRPVILIAGVPRSGSTWLYNAARRLMEEAHLDFISSWIEDWDRNHPASLHLVKAHHLHQVDFTPVKVLTTNRPTEECVASLIRMGWVSHKEEDIRKAWDYHRRLHSLWRIRSSLEVEYEEIILRPEIVLSRVAGILELSIKDGVFQRIARELSEMRAPSGENYDPKTLMHPGHRTCEKDIIFSPEKVLHAVHGQDGL